MSEFTEFYCQRGQNTNDVAALIRQIGCTGYVLPERNGWVTFAVDEPIYEPSGAVWRNSPGTVAYMINSEEGGWGCSLYQGGQIAFRHICTWDYGYDTDFLDDFDPEFPEDADSDGGRLIYMYDSEYDISLIRQAIGGLPREKRILSAVEQCVKDAENESLTPRYGFFQGFHDFCQEMGMVFCSWISHHYLDSNYREGQTFLSDKSGKVPILKVV